MDPWSGDLAAENIQKGDRKLTHPLTPTIYMNKSIYNVLLRGYFGRDVLAQGNTVPGLAYSKAAERYNKKYNDNKHSIKLMMNIEIKYIHKNMSKQNRFKPDTKWQTSCMNTIITLLV